MKQHSLPTVLALAVASTLTLLCGCSTARIAGRREVAAVPAQYPTRVLIADFELDATRIKSEAGPLPAPPKLPGPLGSILPPLPGAPKDPEVLARELVESMSASLMKDLSKAGVNARRLKAGEPLPTNGWLVRGVFTEVNEGNQLRRAVIGFGAGQTDLQVVVDINDLAQGAPRKFFELHTAAANGKAPGAGPMIALSPVGAAARFALSGEDLAKSVKQTAAKIAVDVAQRAQGTQLTSTPATRP